jgi:hypothetical protein
LNKGGAARGRLGITEEVLQRGLKLGGDADELDLDVAAARPLQDKGGARACGAEEGFSDEVDALAVNLSNRVVTQRMAKGRGVQGGGGRVGGREGGKDEGESYWKKWTSLFVVNKCTSSCGVGFNLLVVDQDKLISRSNHAAGLSWRVSDEALHQVLAACGVGTDLEAHACHFCLRTFDIF